MVIKAKTLSNIFFGTTEITFFPYFGWMTKEKISTIHMPLIYTDFLFVM